MNVDHLASGRAAAAQHAAAAIRSGSHVIVTGERGMGKRRFARTLIERMHDRPVLVIDADQRVPGRLGPVLRALSARLDATVEPTDALDMIRGMGPDLVIGVLGGSAIDDATADLTLRLAADHGATIVATIDDANPEASKRGDRLRHLLGAGGTRVDLARLTSAETDAIIDRVEADADRRGALGMGARAWIRVHAGGFSSLASALTRELLARSTAELPEHDAGHLSRDTVRAAQRILEPLSPELLSSLRMLCAIEGVDRERASLVVPRGDLAWLESSGFVSMHRAAVHVPGPFVTSVRQLRFDEPLDARLDAVIRDIANDVADGWPVTGGEVLLAGRRLLTGEATTRPDDEAAAFTLALGAGILSRRGDDRGAVSMARASRRARRLPVDDMLEGMARIGSWSAESLLAAARSMSEVPAPSHRMLLEAAQRPCDTSRCDHMAVAEALDALDDAAASRAAAVVRSHALLRLGDSAGAREAAGAALASAGHEDLARMHLLETRLVAAVHLGRTCEARDAMAALLEVIDADSTTATPALFRHEATRALSVVLLMIAIGADMPAGLDDLVTRRVEGSIRDADTTGATTLLVAMQGLRSTLEGSAPPARSLLAGLPRSSASQAWIEGLEDAVDPSAAPRADALAAPSILAAWWRLRSELDRGNAASAIAQARALRERVGARSVPALIIAAHAACLAGLDPSEASAWLPAETPEPQSTQLGAMIDHVRGLAASDQHRVTAAAATFAETGRHRIAERAVADAEAIARGAGEPASRALRAIGARLRREAMLRDPSTTARLTRREEEIALLASDGESNRSIAQRMYLSVRTVESHLYNATAKLGVASRRELTSVMSQYDRSHPQG